MRAVRHDRGFTLIELLVVIAIIAVLAAILHPVYWRTRESAQQTECFSNMHQIAVAIKAYWQEHRAYPPAPMLIWDRDGDLVPDPVDEWEWIGGVSALVEDYLTTSAVLKCRDDHDANTQAGAVRAKNYSSYNGPPFIIGDVGPDGVPGTQDDILVPEDPGSPTLPPLGLDSSARAWSGGYNYYGYYNDGSPCSGKQCEVSPGVPGLPCNAPGAGDHYIYDMVQAHADPYLADADGDGFHDKKGGKYTDIPSLGKYPRLKNRYAPGNTIIVRCTHHRTLLSSNPENQLDLAINLSGATRKIPWKAWASPNPPNSAPEPDNGVRWVYQPAL